MTTTTSHERKDPYANFRWYGGNSGVDLWYDPATGDLYLAKGPSFDRLGVQVSEPITVEEA